MLTDGYDRVRIISLPDRLDRRREMEQSLGRIGAAISGKISFFDAIRPSGPGPFNTVGAYGCYLSHLGALREAAANNESVLILEDDCEFEAAAGKYRVAPDCDLLFAGFVASNPDDPYNSVIQGAHCTGYSRSAAKTAVAYLTDLLDPNFPPDAEAAQDPNFDPAIRPPFDGALVWLRRRHPELRVTFDNLSSQRASRSDITPLRLERWPIVRVIFRAIRKIAPKDFRWPQLLRR